MGRSHTKTDVSGAMHTLERDFALVGTTERMAEVVAVMAYVWRFKDASYLRRNVHVGRPKQEQLANQGRSEP